jgi:hypothetical protein
MKRDLWPCVGSGREEQHRPETAEERLGRGEALWVITPTCRSRGARETWQSSAQRRLRFDRMRKRRPPQQSVNAAVARLGPRDAPPHTLLPTLDCGASRA